MPAGFHATNVHALLTSESLQARIAELRSEFDNVLIDAPAINPTLVRSGNVRRHDFGSMVERYPS
jgi:hypothetical protein